MSDKPLIWVLKGKRAGDNDQMLAIAEAMDSPTRVVTCRFRFNSRLPWQPTYGRFGPPKKVLHPDSQREIQEFLAQETPQLVLSAGWRSAPVSKWIGEASNCLRVHVGRPRAPLDHFDLVFSPAQYAMPDQPPVHVLPTPPIRVSEDNEVFTLPEWENDFADDRPPYIAIFAGGSTIDYDFNEDAATDLGKKAAQLAEALSAKLLVLTSPRTSQAATDALMAATRDRAQRQIAWQAGAPNPYRFWLTHADGLITTSDSVSMMSEAVATGKRVWLFDTPVKPHPFRRFSRLIDHYLQGGTAPAILWKPYIWLIRRGFIYPPRDVSRIARAFFDTGHIYPLADTAYPDSLRNTQPHNPDSTRTVLQECVAEIQKLCQTKGIIPSAE